MGLLPFLILEVRFTLLVSGFSCEVVGKAEKHYVSSFRQIPDDCVPVEIIRHIFRLCEQNRKKLVRVWSYA